MHPRKSKTGRYLEQYQIEYLKENAAELTSMQLSKSIGCSQATIYWHCKKLYLKTTKSYFQHKPPVIPDIAEYKSLYK